MVALTARLLPRSLPSGATVRASWTLRQHAPLITRRGVVAAASYPGNRSYQTATASAASPEPASPSPIEPGVAPSPTSEPIALKPSRRERIKEAKPFSDFLTDNFHRQHDYLRISVTERCNLRCLYCMPEEGVPLSPAREQLTTPEIVMLSSLFVSQGVTKIRLTGGEPTVRRDIVPLMQQIGALRPHGLREICLTTNGLSLHRKLDAMVEAGLTGINLSLDTLDPWQFQLMTRRAGFSAVQKSIDRIFEMNHNGAGIKFKINCVVMRGLNDREILPFVELTREKDVEVRFIEYMPFDGNKWNEGKMFSYQEMLGRIRAEHPDFHRIEGHKNDTSKTFQVPGFVGKVGFITSMTHNFCGTCNRLRITSDGNLKVCLFGNAEVSLRDIIRRVNDGEPIDEETFMSMKQAALAKLEHRPDDLAGHMIAPNNSEELLEVIGMAVKRKKEKHADLGDLEHMKNRPMILIDSKSHASPYRATAYRTTSSSRLEARSSLSSTFSSSTRLPFIHAAMSDFSTSHQHPRLSFSTTSRPGVPSGKHKDTDASKAATSSPPIPDQPNKLTHVSAQGEAHMVSIADKAPTHRVATAKCTVVFSNPSTIRLIRENQMKKGDVLGVARIAGIMAAKKAADIIPLCHPIAITKVSVQLETCTHNNLLDEEDGNGNDSAHGSVEVTATVECDGKTGVEMEALMAASASALTVYDMCKAVDKGMVVQGLRVVLKEGGRSGRWVEGGKG
ncbi:molybdenum cofactor biosynthesis prote [Rhypophila decipiens]|uniref:Molybdenum cofactor biosynthesis prote n=1 Tax=Rhypophila decipiens TaxID=261697 RepID=A0AAN7BCA3_9PEZI|nr:molybdenum cofactor biosynthesis prote [Rhypophila decipiens]